MGTTDGGTRKSLIFWAVGVFAYMIAVFHRQSLGVTGIDAEARLGVGASGLAMLAMVQLLVYATLQIPVGIMVDRVGSKRMLLIGASVMAAGQLIFALSDGLLSAITGRVLVGGGDAMTFLSVIRIINMSFPPRRYALIVQLTGLLGQVGAIASAVPLIGFLHAYGWTPTFLGSAALGVVSLVMVATLLRDRRPDVATVSPGLRAAWADPGTRLGMWMHAACQSSMTAFVLLWGYPYLVRAQGVSPQTAGVLLTMITIIGMACGPLFGYLAGRFPHRRSWIALGVIGSTAVTWTVVLLWPGHAPLWLLALLMVVLATNGPSSIIGFDFARTFNPIERIGVATGIVNGGGFIASMLVIALIGISMDLLGDFRWAFAMQYPLWILGTVQVLRHRVRARRLLPQTTPALDTT